MQHGFASKAMLLQELRDKRVDAPSHKKPACNSSMHVQGRCQTHTAGPESLCNEMPQIRQLNKNKKT
jgi:hypothetical protein